MTEETIVRQNLMDNVNYRPYCGNSINSHLVRVKYRPEDGQFICPVCKLVTQFPQEFIDRYKAKHNLP